MERFSVDGADLEYETVGRGEPVLLIHGALVCDTFTPLLREPALASYRLIRYRRRGYGGHGLEPPMSVEQNALDARALLDNLDAKPAHIVGHSHGADVGLQLAVDASSAVHTLALLEPGLVSHLPSASAFREGLAPIGQAYAHGEAELAIDMLCQTIFGPQYRRIFEENISEDVFALAVLDAATTFEGDIASLQNWTLDSVQRRSIGQPVLSIVGSETEDLVRSKFGVPLITELRALVQEWLPQTEEVILPGLNHSLQAQGPRAVAEALASFFVRHPILERV